MKKEFLVTVAGDSDQVSIVKGTHLEVNFDGKLFIYDGVNLVAVFSRYDYVLDYSNQKELI